MASTGHSSHIKIDWYHKHMEQHYKSKITIKANIATAAHAIMTYIASKGGEMWAPWLTTNQHCELEHSAAKGFQNLVGLGMQTGCSQKDSVLNKIAKNVRYDSCMWPELVSSISCASSVAEAYLTHPSYLQSRSHERL